MYKHVHFKTTNRFQGVDCKEEVESTVQEEEDRTGVGTVVLIR